MCDISNNPSINLVVASIKASKHKKVLSSVIDAGKYFFAERPVGVGFKKTEEIARATNAIVGTQAWSYLVLEEVSR